MGHNGPSPNRWPIAAWYHRAPTIGQMLDDEWRVYVFCPACCTRIRVSLKLMIKVRGRSFSLWNRQAPCRVTHGGGDQPCGRPAHFEARPNGLNSRIRLAYDGPPSGGRPRMRQPCGVSG